MIGERLFARADKTLVGCGIVITLIVGAPRTAAGQSPVPIACGQTLSGTIAAAAQQNTYTFDGNNGEAIIIAALATSGTLGAVVTVFDPAQANIGATVNNGVGNTSTPVIQLHSTGTYTIVLRDYSFTKTGTYNINLIFPTGRCGTGIVAGQTIGGNLSKVAQQDAFAICVVAPSSIVVSAIATSGALGAYATVFAPGAATVGATINNGVGNTSTPVINLTIPGTYVLVVRDYSLSKTGTYNVNAAVIGPTCLLPPPVFTSQPMNQAVDVGVTAQFTVTATGIPGPTYRWQESVNGGMSWRDLTDGGPYSGTTTAMLSVTAGGGLNGAQYRAVVTNGVTSATSSAATLTITGIIPAAITTHPLSQTVTSGANVTFVVAASGFPVPAYQWQVSTNGGSTWTALTNSPPYSGVTTTTLAITNATVSLNASRYRAVAANSGGTATSTAATLTVRGAVAAAPGALKFAAIKAGAAGALTAVTPAQDVTVTFTGAASAWTASANQPWVQVTNASGSGAGQFTASITNPGNILGGSTTVSATITVTAPTASNGAVIVPVTLTIDQSNATSTAPFGQVDTPVQNTTGVVGAIGVTGWALDNIGVAGVKIYRTCLPFDAPPSCQMILGNNVVFTGDATFVAGVRPDVEAAFAPFPQAYRAGWGFLLLTNMLPHVTNGLAYGGQGPLTLYVFATDAEGNATLLGRSLADHTPTAITMANETIAKPFGAIDTPAQGATVSGTLSNFGWVLTPDSNTTPDNTDILIPLTGSTMNVFIDGVPVGTVGYNNCRGTVGTAVPSGVFCNDDIANIFGNPAPQTTFTPRSANVTKYRNLDAGRGAIGVLSIDTTLLSNGLHSIAWGVTDSAGRVEGIGSRNFIVLNSGADALRDAGADQQTLQALADRPAIVRGSAASVAALEPATTTVWGRTGFDLTTAHVPIPPAADGVPHIGIPELGRLELTLGADVKDGYLVANGTLRDLPTGSHLDRTTGVFTWAPVPGFIGAYRLTFVRGTERIPVDVTIRPAGTVDPSNGEVRMHIDGPGVNQTVSGSLAIAGWALDPQSTIGSGIDAIHVWAKGSDPAWREPGPARSSATPVFLGAATLGAARPDVASAFGAPFGAAGYTLTTSAPAPGEYDLIVYVHSARTGRWEDARTVRITVR